MSEHYDLLPENNALNYLTDDNGDSYNRCHCKRQDSLVLYTCIVDTDTSWYFILLYLFYCAVWSNFEVADLDFFRSDAYMTFFNYLDSTGKFFYERWGDAPVHSIGVALLMPREQIHFFEDIGYYHGPFWNCPSGDLNSKLQCKCQPSMAFNAHGSGCSQKFKDLFPGDVVG